MARFGRDEEQEQEQEEPEPQPESEKRRAEEEEEKLIPCPSYWNACGSRHEFLGHDPCPVPVPVKWYIATIIIDAVIQCQQSRYLGRHLSEHQISTQPSTQTYHDSILLGIDIDIDICSSITVTRRLFTVQAFARVPRRFNGVA
jgi:hypothetical protein